MSAIWFFVSRHVRLPGFMIILQLTMFLILLSLLINPLSGISQDGGCLVVLEFCGLSDVMGVSGDADEGVDQIRRSVLTHIGFQAEMPLVAFLELVHLRVALAILILGRTWRIDPCSIYNGAALEHELLSGQSVVDDEQHSTGKFLFFKQVPEAQEGAFLRFALIPNIQAGKLLVKRCCFHGGVEQAKPQLLEMNKKQQFSWVRQSAGLARSHIRHDMRSCHSLGHN